MEVQRTRIAIFQYNWPLQSYSKDLAIILAENGFIVDFYLFDKSNANHVTINDFEAKKVNLHSFEEKSSNKNLLTKLVWRLMRLFSNKILKAKYVNLDRNILFHSWKKFKRNPSDYIIGIEKQGLNWAGIFSEKYNVPLIYYSLELYIEDHPSFESFRPNIAAERYYHAKAIATIIQDQFRKKELFKANNCSNTPLYIPVSVRGISSSEKTTFLHKKLGIEQTKKILLYFGGMASNRFCEEIVQFSEKLSDDYITVFHGFGRAEYLSFLQKISNPSKVLFSNEQLPENEIHNVIRSAYIGFAIYSNNFSNDRFTAYSSQKIAFYCQYGLPFISMQNESFDMLFSEFACGTSILSKDDLELAIQTIDNNYSSYVKEAINAYNKVFKLDNHIKNLIQILK